ncbi:MAG: PPC domain-containing protein [Deltaproteobacteria bacterium]|nr:PPC domain-containing protein [Deltaproteobacteria bacterium]
MACHKSGSPKADGGAVDAGPVCATNDDCADGEVCDSATGRCSACKSSGQCKPHQLCQAPARNEPLACVYAEGYGDDCKLNDDCPAGQLCHQGLCLPSSEVTTCPTGACPSGQRCNKANLVCEENSGCFTDDDCQTTEVCNTATHACDLRCTADNVDTVCAAGQKCANGRCAQCGQDSDCPGGLTCDTAAGTCTNGNTCFSDRDCQVPLVCNPTTSQCTQPPPPCVSDEQCKVGYMCDLASGRCALAGCQPDAYEPDNHSQATAAAIGPGPVITVNSLSLCGGEQDFFSFAMLQGDIVQVVVNADALAATTFDTALLDPQGRVIGSGDLAVNAQADSDGTYAVRVHSSDDGETYSLRVTIDHTASSCQNDAYEPNDTFAQATHVVPPGLNTLAICAGDHDWFSIDVPASLGVNIAESSDPLQGDLDLYVYASDGTTLLGQSATSNATELVQLGPSKVAGARAYALVQGGDARSENQYTLSVVYRTDEPDAGPVDAGPVDAGDVDGGASDAGQADAGNSDAGSDGGPSDGGG